MIKVLSLRGGGIRGFATAILLAELEKKIGRPLADVFDLIAGTSVGAIMATGLALKLPAAQLVEFFEKEGPVIFRRRRFGRLFLMLGHPRYDVEDLKAALGRHFDAGDVKGTLGLTFTKLLVTSTRYRGLQSRLWKSWKHPELSAVEAAASSAAAPTFFAPVEIGDFAHADGGCYANNPAAIAACEAKKIWPMHAIALIDIACPDDKSQFEPRAGGILDVAPHIASTFIGSGEDIMSYLAEKQLGGSGRMLTIAPPLLDANHDIGDASRANLRQLRKCAEYAMEKNVDDIMRTLGK